MTGETKAIVLPLAILGILIVGLGFGYWFESRGHEDGTATEDSGKHASCSACEHDGAEIPAAGLLEVRSQLPAFTFEDQDGGRTGLEQLEGSVWIADFIYIKCAGPCPAMTVAMKKMQDLTDDLPGLKFVTFTVDPERDTVADLKAYANNTEADPERWFFLRGPADELKNLMVDGFKIGVHENPLNHSTRFCLVDQTGRVRGHYDYKRGDQMIRLRRDARLLLTGERH